MRSIDNTEDVIDSRDIVERVEELADMMREEPGIGVDEHAELRALARLSEQVYDAEQWRDGVTLIRDTYFTEYIRDQFSELSADLWELMNKANVRVDWDAMADDQYSDYTPLEFGTVTYLVQFA